eukprot:TRINITY_DN290_c0_g1_i1.p1 TRINITY_DN290_c0_g1~~TRINITY_DN290_c0_g1_i1.p1  ORF type:complete len:198 (-),score=32.05 TRINITY_DN290_c0_g1_i1:297-890(-)
MSYFKEEDFTDYSDVDFALIQLTMTESYDEKLISQKIQEIGKQVCCAVAIQLAIVGYGGHNYNNVIVDSKEIVIQNFFNDNGIKSKLPKDSKLAKDDLTPRRLIRFFRYKIKEYLEQNDDVSSYLYRKYCADTSERNRTMIFPGAEYMLDPSDDEGMAVVLWKTYGRLDDLLKTDIKKRIERIFVIRKFDDRLFSND